MLPPSSRLSPISEMASQSPNELLESLNFLRRICIPEVRGSRNHASKSQEVLVLTSVIITAVDLYSSRGPILKMNPFHGDLMHLNAPMLFGG
jgi:hypothetical protein